MNEDRYYYANEQNQPVGPFGVDELMKLQEQSLIVDTTLVCVEGGSDWISLSQLVKPVTPSQSPPPIPSAQPSKQDPIAEPVGDSRSAYQKTAETVGMIPDLSGKRNLIQLAITIPIALIFALWGLARGGGSSALFYGFGGLIVGVLASGAVLMVLGWKKG